jgi:hypothetical protein
MSPPAILNVVGRFFDQDVPMAAVMAYVVSSKVSDRADLSVIAIYRLSASSLRLRSQANHTMAHVTASTRAVVNSVDGV